ncbi:MAG: acylphosphatase [Sedimentisphaerales bacterium]|nr:acylphosphatase [Sedimentisphaerales bacterium]
MISRHIYYRGQVQGVGFRYTAVRTAANYDVSGYVRNLADGRVEVVAEGLDREIAAFLADLEEAMAGCIRGRQEQDAPASGHYRGFTVRY